MLEEYLKESGHGDVKLDALKEANNLKNVFTLLKVGLKSHNPDYQRVIPNQANANPILYANVRDISQLKTHCIH
jgi:hypothetical protein